MTDEQKQRYKENKNKRDKDIYNKMTDEQEKKRKIIKENIEKI